MKRSIKLLLAVLILLLLLLVSILLILFVYTVRLVNSTDHSEYGLSITSSRIPKVIYTFWNTPSLSSFVTVCIASWRRHNPAYEIVILTPDNVSDYGLEGVLKLRHANNHQRTADFLRCSILKKNGGIWLDASVYLNQSLDWVHWYQQKFDSEFVGYSIKSCGSARSPDLVPIVENWFMACIPDSRFVADWHDRFMTINDYTQVDDYVESIKINTDLSGIPCPNYLTMHIAALRIMQDRNYQLSLLSAENGPFLYLDSMLWQHFYFVLFILWFKGKEAPMIKYRGYERKYIENWGLERWYR
jgi:hypothetical protein